MQEEPIIANTEAVAPGKQPGPQGHAPGLPVEDSPVAHTQRPVSYASGPPMEEDDEINLLDLFIVLLRHKGMILSIVLLTGIAAVIISLRMKDIYRSECTISPTTQEKVSGGLAALGGFGAMIASEVGIGASGSLDQFDVVLKSRELTNVIVQQHKLLPVIFDESWDAQAGTWKAGGKPSIFQNASAALMLMLKPAPEKDTKKDAKSDAPKTPSLQDAYEAMQGMLKVTADKKQNVMRLSFEYKDAKMAQTILNYYVVGLSEFLRRQTTEETAAQRAQLTEQLAKTTDPLLKNRLYELIAKQIEKETLTKIQRYYSFNVIDPAFVPEKKFKPSRSQICLLSVVVAFFVAVFLAFFLEYVHNLKKREDPERLANLRAALGLRRRRV